MPPEMIVAVPGQVVNLVQSGMLERAFHDGLFPALLYRQEAQWEEWEANIGTEIFMSRPGLLSPNTTPLTPGQDPTPQTLTWEQWAAVMGRYGDAIDVHMPTSAVANSDLFLRSIHQLGLQAGQSINRVARNRLFKAYLGGNTRVITQGTTAQDRIHVAALNGFTFSMSTAAGLAHVRPQPLSAVNVLPIHIGTVAHNVIATVPDYAADPDGPGDLVVAGTLGATIAVGTAVTSDIRPRIIRIGGGATTDALTASDTFVMQAMILGVSYLRRNSVPPHEDGYYHLHANMDANAQYFADDAVQRMLTARPEHVAFQEAIIGVAPGCVSYLNNESPDPHTAGNRISTGGSAYYSEDIGAETTNYTGVDIARCIITGRGALYERGLDEAKYVSEAGITGKIGEFQVVNMGIQIPTNNVKLILRAPVNRMQDMVGAAWSITTDFPVPSDITSGLPAMFKRAVCIEHCGGTVS